MGSGISSPLHQNIDALHNQLMKHGGADYDIATTTTLSYSQFLTYITELNKICANYKDKQGCVLVFAVKKGTDSSLFWKATIRIACVKFNTNEKKVESHRLLNIRHFLQVFRRISYECTAGAVGIPSSRANSSEGATANPPHSSVPPTLAASIVFGEAQLKEVPASCSAEKKNVPKSSLEECAVCLDRNPELILPCCHAYCAPCIEQWWEYCQEPVEDVCLPRNFLESMDINEKNCPVCRESLDSAEDTWVISEAPDEKEVSDEIRKVLSSYATNESTDEYWGASSAKKRDDT